MPTLGDRLHRAILAYQSQIGRRVTYAELGVAFAKQEKRAKPYTAAAVSEWIQGRGEPKLGAIQAIAHVLNVPAEWLAFGSGEPLTIPAPVVPTHGRRGRPATARELGLETETPASKKKAGGRN